MNTIGNNLKIIYCIPCLVLLQLFWSIKTQIKYSLTSGDINDLLKSFSFSYTDNISNVFKLFINFVNISFILDSDPYFIIKYLWSKYI